MCHRKSMHSIINGLQMGGPIENLLTPGLEYGSLKGERAHVLSWTVQLWFWYHCVCVFLLLYPFVNSVNSIQLISHHTSLVALQMGGPNQNPLTLEYGSFKRERERERERERLKERERDSKQGYREYAITLISFGFDLLSSHCSNNHLTHTEME